MVNFVSQPISIWDIRLRTAGCDTELYINLRHPTEDRWVWYRIVYQSETSDWGPQCVIQNWSCTSCCFYEINWTCDYLDFLLLKTVCPFFRFTEDLLLGVTKTWNGKTERKNHCLKHVILYLKYTIVILNSIFVLKRA